MAENSQGASVQFTDMEPTEMVTSVSLLQQLPEEILLHIFSFLRDIDLQEMKQTNIFFRSLCSDLPLWHYFYRQVYANRINRRLDPSQRTSRADLLRNNIIRGALPHQLQRGLYINGPSQREIYHVQGQLNRFMLEQRLSRGLTLRPSKEEMQRSNLLPQVLRLSKLVIGPSGKRRRRHMSLSLVPRAMALNQQLKCNRLARHLRHRRSFQDLTNTGVAKENNVSPGIVAAKIKVEREFTRIRLRRKLQKRPSYDVGDERDSLDNLGPYPSFTKSHVNMDHRRQALGPMILTRPSVGQMEQEKMIKDLADLAIKICPGVKDKITFYNNLSAISESADRAPSSSPSPVPMHHLDRPAASHMSVHKHHVVGQRRVLLPQRRRSTATFPHQRRMQHRLRRSLHSLCDRLSQDPTRMDTSSMSSL